MLVDIAYLFAAVVISPVVIYRMVRHGRYRAGWGNRFGKISRRHPERKCIWIHAVSVGEVNATKTLVAELEEKLADYEVVISTTTDTGFARASKLYGERLSVFYFPLDFSCAMRRAFENIRPSICLLMELEVWPNFVRIARERGAAVVVVNGRVSDGSFGKYKRISRIAKKVFRNVSLILAQTEEYAERFRQIGADGEKVVVTGSLKYDTAQVGEKVPGADELAEQLGLGDERLWVAGATGNDEEGIILDVYKKLKEAEDFSDLQLVIVPRKPERFEEVATLIKQTGFELVRYSEVKEGNIGTTVKSKVKTVVLGDTMGDLRKFYSLATMIFVGRSLVAMGGSDMMEAAALGKCTVFGPYCFNFRHTVDALLAGEGAILVQNGDELFDAMKRCLGDSEYSRRIASNGQEIIRANQGATARTVAAIGRLITEKPS